MERLRRTLRILLPLLTLYSVASNALGKEPNAQDVTGILREEKQPGDVGRAVANALLYLPRNVIEWSFLATESIANLVAEKSKTIDRI